MIWLRMFSWLEHRFAAGVAPEHDVEQVVELVGRAGAVLLDQLVEGAMQVGQLGRRIRLSSARFPSSPKAAVKLCGIGARPS